MARHLLVVEDEVLTAFALEDYLTLQGYRVTVANDGQGALRAWERDPADAVITDLAMPGMSGFDLVRRLRAIDAKLPVVVLTGSSASAPMAGALKSSAPERTHIFEKPTDLADVHHEITRMLA